LNSTIDRRLAKLERVNNPNFIVRFPDKQCEDGEETFNNTLIPPGFTCVIDLTWADMAHG